MSGVLIQNTLTGWQDVYALSGFTPGTALLIQNQHSLCARLRESTLDASGYRVDSGIEREATGTAVLQAQGNTGLMIYVQQVVT